MTDRIKGLFKDSVVYGFGGVAAKSLGFFLLPVYTRIFSPADYGIIELLVVTGGGLAAVLVLGMDSAQSFFFFKEKKAGIDAQAGVVTAILQWRLLWGTVVVAGALLVSPILNTRMFDGKLDSVFFLVVFLGILMSQLAGQSAEVFRLLYRPWTYLGLTLGRTVLVAAFILLLILGCGAGVFGYFAGGLAASFLMAGVGWWIARSYLDFSRLHREKWPRFLKFSLPLVPRGLILFLMATTDRWCIAHFLAPEALGLYAVAAKFSMLMTLVVVTFRQALWPIALDALQSADGPDFLRTTARFYLGLGSAGIVVLTAFSPFLVRLLTPAEYHQAYPVIGILAWQPLFYGFSLIAAAGMWKVEKTGWSAFTMAFTAVLNVVLNILLIPRLGINGAALATAVSFLIWNLADLAVSEHFWPVRYPAGVLSLVLLIGVGAVGAILTLHQSMRSGWWVALVTLGAVSCLSLLSFEKRYLGQILKKISP